MKDAIDEVPIDDAPGSAMTRVTDAVGGILSGTSLPAPIRRNALRAFNQLCTAAIDIPVAYLEGVAAERRAESAARVRIISTGADQIAQQMQMDPEYAKAAVKKFGQRIIREQINLDQISQGAARELKETVSHQAKSGAEVESDPAPIDDDWLNVFEREARLKSTADMQQVFAKILAGEIRQPATFSIKTVKLLGQLDADSAALFRRLCSLSVSLQAPGRVIDARVVSLDGNAAANSLQAYGLNFGNLNTLNEYGLIIADYNSYMDYRFAVVAKGHAGVPLTYQGAGWVLVPVEDYVLDQSLHLHGVALTRAGAELLKVVEPESDEPYTSALIEFFKSRKLAMTRLAVTPGA